jgi:hypothetical protein
MGEPIGYVSTGGITFRIAFTVTRRTYCPSPRTTDGPRRHVFREVAGVAKEAICHD